MGLFSFYHADVHQKLEFWWLVVEILGHPYTTNFVKFIQSHTTQPIYKMYVWKLFTYSCSLTEHYDEIFNKDSFREFVQKIPQPQLLMFFDSLICNDLDFVLDLHCILKIFPFFPYFIRIYSSYLEVALFTVSVICDIIVVCLFPFLNYQYYLHIAHSSFNETWMRWNRTASFLDSANRITPITSCSWQRLVNFAVPMMRYLFCYLYHSFNN